MTDELNLYFLLLESLIVQCSRPVVVVPLIDYTNGRPVNIDHCQVYFHKFAG